MRISPVVAQNHTDDYRARVIRLGRRLFRPLVRLLLRHHVLVSEMEQIVRWEAIQLALRDPEFAIRGYGRKSTQTFSHAAVVTGLSRQEIAVAADMDDAPLEASCGHLHRMIRVITAWRTDAGYQDVNGHPIDLPLRGPEPSFHALCRKYGRDTPTRPIADALVKNGNAAWIPPGENTFADKALRFRTDAITAERYTDEDMNIMSQIGSDFLHSFQMTFKEGVTPRPRVRECYFNDIDQDKLDEARELIYGEIQQFTQRCLEVLKPFRASPGNAHARLGAGSYSFVDAPHLLQEFREELRLASSTQDPSEKEQ